MPDLLDIHDDDELYRRIPRGHIKRNGQIGSPAFLLDGKPDPQISVELARVTTPEATLGSRDGEKWFVGGILAAVPRSLTLEVVHDPLEGNWAHAEIRGNDDMAKSRTMARHTRFVLD